MDFLPSPVFVFLSLKILEMYILLFKLCPSAFEWENVHVLQELSISTFHTAHYDSVNPCYESDCEKRIFMLIYAVQKQNHVRFEKNE